jgi:cytoskeletal protein RodZ
MRRFKNYKASSRKKSQASRKRLLFKLLVLVAVVAGILFVLDRKGVIDLPFTSDPQPTTSPDGINYGPPTAQEKAAANEAKENISNDKATDSTPETPTPSAAPTSGKKSVTPVMTSWGPNGDQDAQARGFVPGITEEGGTCTLTLTKGGVTVTESKEATPDASTVSCGLITIDRSRLTTGSWTATLSYSSTKSEGKSSPNTIEVE